MTPWRGLGEFDPVTIEAERDGKVDETPVVERVEAPVGKGFRKPGLLLSI